MNILHQGNQVVVDGTYAIPSRADETFEAKDEIRWKPGFRANAGSIVRAKITPNAVFAASKMDELTYHYSTGNNKLQYVSDAVSSTAYAGDLDSQPSNNYVYDGNGNMLQDLEKGIGYVLYDINNLPIRVCKTNGDVIDYIYDSRGERAKKITANLSTWYINGVGSKTSFIKTSKVNDSYTVNLYGNDAIGQARVVGGVPIRYYYLKDHLGSIRVTVDGTYGTLASYDDYYPLGMVMDNRSANFGNADTRYKFTGKERDVETGYDYFGARYYDSRIGRWLAPDPLAEKYPGWSTYNYVLNNPLKLFDPNGKWPTRIHNRILETAFKGILSNIQIEILKNASIKVDKDQSLEGSFKHAMRAPNQDIKDAEQKMNEFISKKQQQFIEGKGDAALEVLGEALHPIMDRTSPAHEGFQVWYGIPVSPNELMKEIYHAKRENLNLSDKEIENLAKPLRDFYIETLKKAERNQKKKDELENQHGGNK